MVFVPSALGKPVEGSLGWLLFLFVGHVICFPYVDSAAQIEWFIDTTPPRSCTRCAILMEGQGPNRQTCKEGIETFPSRTMCFVVLLRPPTTSTIATAAPDGPFVCDAGIGMCQNCGIAEKPAVCDVSTSDDFHPTLEKCQEACQTGSFVCDLTTTKCQNCGATNPPDVCSLSSSDDFHSTLETCQEACQLPTRAKKSLKLSPEVLNIVRDVCMKEGGCKGQSAEALERRNVVWEGHVKQILASAPKGVGISKKAAEDEGDRRCDDTLRQKNQLEHDVTGGLVDSDDDCLVELDMHDDPSFLPDELDPDNFDQFDCLQQVEEIIRRTGGRLVRKKRTAIDFSVNRRDIKALAWIPDQTIPVLIVSNDSEAIAIIKDAVAEISDRIECLTLTVVDKVPTQDYIAVVTQDFTKSRGASIICGSAAPGKFGRRSEVSIGLHPICRESLRGSVIHEIGHVLGMYHHHSRADRTRFLFIKEQNADPRVAAEVKRERTQFYESTYGTSFDYTSVMHYGATAYSRRLENGTKLNTFEPKPFVTTLKAKDLGTFNKLGCGDIELLRRMYCCPKDCIDRDNNCGFWASGGSCTSKIFGANTKKRCPRSCGVCCPFECPDGCKDSEFCFRQRRLQS